MDLSNLRPRRGDPSKKRIGRGQGSGQGVQAGRGHKGREVPLRFQAQARGFEGGQMPLRRGVPKRGSGPSARSSRSSTSMRSASGSMRGRKSPPIFAEKG